MTDSYLSVSEKTKLGHWSYLRFNTNIVWNEENLYIWIWNKTERVLSIICKKVSCVLISMLIEFRQTVVSNMTPRHHQFLRVGKQILSRMYSTWRNIQPESLLNKFSTVFFFFSLIPGCFGTLLISGSQWGRK